MRNNESLSIVPKLVDEQEQEAMDEERTLLRPRPPQVESVLSELEPEEATSFEQADAWFTGASRREHGRVPDELLPPTVPPPPSLPSVIPLTDDDLIEIDGQAPPSVEPDPFRST